MKYIATLHRWTRNEWQYLNEKEILPNSFAIQTFWPNLTAKDFNFDKWRHEDYPHVNYFQLKSTGTNYKITIRKEISEEHNWMIEGF